MQTSFSIYLTGFRKNHGTQHALLKMIETWKIKLNIGHKVGVVYMDLSNAFDSLNYKLLIVNWIFCSKKSTKKINAVHERSLRVSLLLIIRGSTPYNISSTMYKFSCDRSL